MTGTKQDHPEFQRLMADCEADVRRLRGKGISVYIEEENIDTLSEGGKLMLTTLSAFAQ